MVRAGENLGIRARLELGGEPVGQQSFQFRCHDAVALARGPFQLRPIEHFNAAATVPDRSGGLQLHCCLRDGLASHAEHVANELMRHLQSIGGQAIQAHEQQTTELLICRVVAVAHCGLRHLREQGLRVAQHQVLQRASAAEFLFEQRTAEPVGHTGAVHDRPVRRDLVVRHQRDANHAFVAEHGNFGGCAALREKHQRDDRINRKVHVLLDVTGLIENVTQPQRHQLQAGEQACARLYWQGAE